MKRSMRMFRNPRVAVFPGREPLSNERTLAAVGYLYSVDFVRAEELRAGLYDAALLFGGTREFALRIAQSGLRCMAFLEGESRTLGQTAPGVHLSSCCYLHPALRGVALPDEGLRRIRPRTAAAGEQVVARRGDDALWTYCSEGPAAVDLVAMDPPELREGEKLVHYFTNTNWARLLPIMHFLREVSGWEPPPPRACFMLDDPNLHWKSYGYIQYPRLLRHAIEHNYHVAFATIPFDAWYVHGATARLFRRGSSRFSLLIHGNNHTLQELGDGFPDEARRANAAQALLRARRLEKAFGLEVARVMTAPHEAYDLRTGAVLARVGFDALCNLWKADMVQGSSAARQAGSGLSPAEFLADIMPVIPRLRMRHKPYTDPRFEAFLGQPIVLAGHHEDLADGLKLLEHLADLINSIGGVRWMGMKGIAESNFCSRRERDALAVKMFSRRIRVDVPEGVRRLSVERPWLEENRGEGLTVLRPSSDPETIEQYDGEFISVTPGEEIVIAAKSRDAIDPASVRTSRPSFWAVTRRLLAETWDRATPIADKLSGRGGKKHE